jgi:hypothetical protein
MGLKLNGRLDRSIGYTVAEILTPMDSLIVWTADPAEQQKALSYSDISYFPVKSGKQITGIVRRRGTKVDDERPLTVDWLIGADTTILQLLDLFARDTHRIFLVLQASEIVGLVAPADLNKVPARASVYLLTAQFEVLLVELIREVLNDDEQALRDRLDEGRRKQLEKAYKSAQKGDVQLDFFRVLYFKDLLDLAKQDEAARAKLGFTCFEDAEKALDLAFLRNSVSHLTGLMIKSRAELVKTNQDCETIISLSNRLRGNARR